MGKLCSELKVGKEVNLSDQEKPFDDNANYKKALRFADKGYQVVIMNYIQTIIERIEERELLEKARIEENKRLEQERNRYPLYFDVFDQFTNEKRTKDGTFNTAYSFKSKANIFRNIANKFKNLDKIPPYVENIDILIEECEDYVDEFEKKYTVAVHEETKAHASNFIMRLLSNLIKPKRNTLDLMQHQLISKIERMSSGRLQIS